MVRHREHQENVRLVRLVKQHPCLYDFGMSEYSDREHIEKVWKKIGDELDENPQNVRDKWRNLRTVFLRKLKAEQNGQTLKCKYYLMDEMKFIMPFVKMTVPYQITTKTDEDIVLDTSNKTTDDDEDAQISKRTRIKRRVKAQPIEEPRECEEYEVVLEEPFPQTSQGSDSKKDKLIRTLMHEIDTENESYSINFGEVKPKKRKYSSSETDNPRKMFLLSLLPEMEQMTDKQMSFFRRKVLALLDDILYSDD
uniref:Putative alcohol dehydrogenase transcription factor myb/sant-like protein n=1 Tax=Nyssomyia neivai TaxID=330878 RepID=A0A1L8DFR0_9DIPT